MIDKKKTDNGNTQIGENFTIRENVIFVGKVKIGNNCKIGNNVILKFVSIGDNSKIEDNSVIGYGTLTGHFYAQNQHQEKSDSAEETKYKIMIGKNVLIRTGVTIYLGTNIGDNCWINHNAVVREEVNILEDTSIGSHTFVDNNVSIGKRCVIHNHTMICNETVIESYVFVGPNVTFTNNSPISHLRDVSPAVQGVTLRLGCAIGGGATLCPGVEIGQEAMVAAGSVVYKSVPSRILVAGNPAIKIKDVPPTSFIKKEIREKYGI